MPKKRDRVEKRGDSGKKRRRFSKRHPKAAGILWGAIPIAVIAVAITLVYRTAALYFFSQDDFTSLWIAREAPKTFWRILSSFVYFRAASSLFDLNSVAFHVAALFFHFVNGVLVFLIAKALSANRGTSLVAAILFVAHPALYAALYSISCVGEILSCLFLLLASLYLLSVRRPGSLLTIPIVSLLFAASLLSKEITITFPVLAGLIFVVRGVKIRKALPALLSLLAVAVVYAALFYYADVFGIRETLSGMSSSRAGTEEVAPYTTALGPELITSVQTYFKWAFNVFASWHQVEFNVLDKQALPWLFVGIGIFLVLMGRRGSHRVKAAYCVLWFLLMLLPVIPLTSHPYHYYLYAPLAGLCPAFGILLARWFRRSRGEVLASASIIVFFVANSALLVSRIENTPVADSTRRKDPVFDRALISRNLISDLRELSLPPETKLLLVSPLREINEGKVSERPFLVMGGAYWDDNLRSAIAEGLGVRLFFPQVDTVAFATEAGPRFQGFLSVGYTWDGRLRFDTVRRLVR